MDKQSTAYHEAGHAVVAHVLGLDIEKVTIIGDEESAGQCIAPLPENFMPYDDEDYELMEKHLMTNMGGAAADELRKGERPSLIGNDRDGAFDLVSRLAGGNEDEQLEISEQAHQKAKRILGSKWGAVESLAETLIRCEELNGDQAVEAMQLQRKGEK